MVQVKADSNDNSKRQKKDAASNFKLITTTTGVRVSQACDRCRIKKIKCDGLTPCHNCQKIGFECKTSDKLTRRAFPKGYTETLEKQVRALEEENRLLKSKYEGLDETDKPSNEDQSRIDGAGDGMAHKPTDSEKIMVTTNQNHRVQINNPIDQIFNLDNKGIIIGNDNLNFESQFNHLLINLNLPFLKISNSHNYLLNDPHSYLYNPSYTMHNLFHNRDLDVIYNPLTANNSQHDDSVTGISTLANTELPKDIYDLFIKLINNFKNLFNNKKELDHQVTNFFLNYNSFIPIFDYKQFMKSYDAFHTMYPFMFTYDDATINGFNILSNDYHIVNEYLMVVVQLYAMIMMNDPTINLNLMLNHMNPGYSYSKKTGTEDNKLKDPLIRSLYDFLPYFNVFHVSIPQLQTYLLFFYYSLLTNNKEKSLILSSLVNSFIGILGINLNAKNLFFNDLTLDIHQKRTRVKIFWVFKVLLKCFNLKFGFKPSLNTTVINPVTIERYFELTPSKLSLLLDDGPADELFNVLLKPSIEFLNLVNIIIPSSFSPNYYQYLKHSNNNQSNTATKKHPKHLDWILNDDDGDGNDGNLNYNFNQFSIIDKNLSNWRYSLKDKYLDLLPLHKYMGLSVLSSIESNNLYLKLDISNIKHSSGLTQEGIINYINTGVPDIHTASQIIKIQLNFHYLLIRSMNYLNFVIDKELTNVYHSKIANISMEVLAYFMLIFDHVGMAEEVLDNEEKRKNKASNNLILDNLGIDVDEDGFVINDFSVKRKKNNEFKNNLLRSFKRVPHSIFNYMLNGLSMTIINLKKSILLQMLYLLICQMKVTNKGGQVPPTIRNLLLKSVDLFIAIFINYKFGASLRSPKTSKEDNLFQKLINDELRDQILQEPRNNDESDDEDYIGTSFGPSLDIDWDDETMDEDLKYLKILKFIKYKVEEISQPKENIFMGNVDSKVSPLAHTSSKFNHSLDEGINNNLNPLSSHSTTDVSGVLVDSTEKLATKQPNSSNSVTPLFPSINPPMNNQAFFGHQNEKLPSIPKFDFAFGNDNFPHLAATSPQYPSIPNPSGSPLNRHINQGLGSDVYKKEKAANDLINLKQNLPFLGLPPFPATWSGNNSVATSPVSNNIQQHHGSLSDTDPKS